MPTFLFNVADTWRQANRSSIVISDRPQREIDHEFGDTLELRFPDGTIVQSKSLYLLLDRPEVDDPPLALAFEEGVVAEIPIGTEVWRVNNERPTKKLHRMFERK